MKKLVCLLDLSFYLFTFPPSASTHHGADADENQIGDGKDDGDLDERDGDVYDAAHDEWQADEEDEDSEKNDSDNTYCVFHKFTSLVLRRLGCFFFVLAALTRLGIRRNHIRRSVQDFTPIFRILA